MTWVNSKSVIGMKVVKAVSPYIHQSHLNFKVAPYNSWMAEGGETTKTYYPWRLLHGLAYRYALPCIKQSREEAHLRFVEPVSINFDTFPDTALYEIIPMIWDCWPCYFEKVCTWFKKYRVKTAIFASSQTAERMRERFPDMNIMFCPEGIDVSCYKEGLVLKERTIDLLEFGRSNDKVLKADFPNSVNHVCTKVNGKFVFSNEQLYSAMGDAKVTIALPRSITQPEIAGDVETLTQRYWECMLSRIVMVGHAPKELIDLIGYNPVIEMDYDNPVKQITDILTHIEDYQELVDKNRAYALKYGDWTLRMKEVMRFLERCGYEV